MRFWGSPKINGVKRLDFWNLYLYCVLIEFNALLIVKSCSTLRYVYFATFKILDNHLLVNHLFGFI